jgi:hypothetical protein
MHRRPPGARAFSRLPNDKKGKALGTRLESISHPSIACHPYVRIRVLSKPGEKQPERINIDKNLF